MQRTLILTLCCLCLYLLPGRAQDQAPLQLELTHHKTTSLVFPSAIQSVDRGTQEVLAQVPAGLSHILQVKAARPGIGETNLTVITANGHLYSFEIRYAPRPQTTYLALPPPTPAVPFPGEVPLPNRLQAISTELAADGRQLHGIWAGAGGATARLEGIYFHANTLFLRVVVCNDASLPFELDFYRVSIRDRKQARRTARQEVELVPRYVHGDATRHLPAGKKQVFVFALDKVTLARDKELQLMLFEAKGDRHLRLRIKGRHLLQALPFPFCP